MGERDRDGRIGLRSWAACTELHLDPSGIEAGPRSAPNKSGSCCPQAARLHSQGLNCLYPRMIRGCQRSPAAAGPEPELRGAGGGHCPKQEALRPRSKERFYKPGAPDMLWSLLPSSILSPPHRTPTPPPPPKSLPPPRGGRGPGRANERNRKIRTEGGEMRRWDREAGVDLGLRLRLPSTPGHGAAEQAGTTAPAGCPVLPLSLPRLRLPRPACPC